MPPNQEEYFNRENSDLNSILSKNFIPQTSKDNFILNKVEANEDNSKDNEEEKLASEKENSSKNEDNSEGIIKC